jgi:hypothetical protein
VPTREQQQQQDKLLTRPCFSLRHAHPVQSQWRPRKYAANTAVKAHTELPLYGKPNRNILMKACMLRKLCAILLSPSALPATTADSPDTKVDVEDVVRACKLGAQEGHHTASGNLQQQQQQHKLSDN